MWTSIHLSTQVIWDQVNWTVTATWHEDPASEPVTLAKSGSARAHTAASPQEILEAVVSDLVLLSQTDRGGAGGR